MMSWRERHQQDNAAISDGAIQLGSTRLLRLRSKYMASMGTNWLKRCFTALIALEAPEPDCGDHHAGHQQGRDCPKLSGQVAEDFHGTHAKGMLDAAAFMERPDIEPARLRIPP